MEAGQATAVSARVKRPVDFLPQETRLVMFFPFVRQAHVSRGSTSSDAKGVTQNSPGSGEARAATLGTNTSANELRSEFYRPQQYP